MVAFQPGRDIDQPREAGGVAFGKTVAAEAFDLRKAPRREIGVIAARQHAVDEPIPKPADCAHAFERGKGTAQLVGLCRGKAGGNHGNLHGLFLKQRHAISVAQHFHHLRSKVFNRFFPLAAVNERVHHAALNGAGADNGDLADQIVKGARAHAR